MAITWTKQYKININGRPNYLIVSKWFNPYYKQKGTDRCTLTRISRRVSGLYFIRSRRTKKIIYIGYSLGRLYYTMYRHFEQWTTKYHEPVTFSRDSVQVRVLFCEKHHVERLEHHFIRKYKPAYNRMQYDTEFIETKVTGAPKLEEDIPF
ncbi:MAG: hypothetical protein PHS93_10315 [Candidatus Omnitrophica bacterium]|nr:hypothetical protein [Candidatus Omnitrophota bacterium]MDD5353544.1 hypothetical protein [Candidatus Omnitrophota bacterium]